MSFQRMFRIPCDRMLKHPYPGLHMRSTERHGGQESRLSSCSKGRRDSIWPLFPKTRTVTQDWSPGSPPVVDKGSR